MSEKIGDYRILESNGQDAHSTYHLASSPGGRELVWLVLSSHRIPPEGRQRATEILREAARLNHSGILEVREAAVDRQGRPFMVHGIPKGTTLETLLKKNGALDVAFALSIGIQVGHALQHAHEKGIVLGTLEEAHVLVDESGAVRVRGFGIHSAIESAEEMVNLSGGKEDADFESWTRLLRRMVREQDWDTPLGGQLRDWLVRWGAIATPLGDALELLEGELTRHTEQSAYELGAERLGGMSFFFLLHPLFREDLPSGTESEAEMTKPVADESGNRMATDEPRESPAGWGDDLGGILEEGSLSVEAGADLPPKREYTALDNLAASEEEAAQQKERWIRTGLITVAAGVGLLVVVAGYQALFGMTPEEIAKREMIREFPRFEEDYEDLEVVRVEPQPAFDSGQKEGLFPSWMVVVDTLLGEGDLEAAREKMTAFAAQDPGDTLRAVACANLLLPEHAEKAKEVLETHRLNVPNASAAHFVLARTLTEPLEEWESALTLLKEMPPTTRETPAYLSLLYTVQEGRADWEGCILTLRTLLKVPGFDTPENQTLLAANYSRAGHMEKAKEVFGDLLLQDGKVSEDAFWSYVEIREQLKELKPLMEVTQSLRRKDPSCSASLLYEAEYSLSRRQYSAALAQLDELEALEPSWRVEFLRAVTWMRMGKLRDARILLNKLKTEREDDPYIAYNLGMVFRAQERDKLAYAEFARAFELDDRLWAPLCAMGQDYHATEQWDSARNVFERAQERSPNHPWIGELLKVEMNSKKAADWVVRPCLVTEYFESVRYSLPRKEPRLALIPHGNWQVEVFSPESRRLSELATSP